MKLFRSLLTGVNLAKTGSRQPLLSLLAYGFVLASTLAGAIVTGLDLNIVQVLEQRLHSIFFRVRGPVTPPDDLVILAMDENTLAQLDFYLNGNPEDWPKYVQWLASSPWQRIAHATVVDRLMQAGAKGVAIDIIFAGPSAYGPADDQALRTVLTAYSQSIALAAEYLEEDAQESLVIDLVEPSLEIQGTIAPILGFVNALPSADGRIHSLPHRYRQQVLRPLGLRELPAFSEAALQAAQVSYPEVQGNDIFFYGGPQTFPHISFWSVLEPQSWQQHLANQTFNNKIVLIGPTAAGFQDLHPVPFSDQMAGVEIHANAAATLLEGRSLRLGIPNPLGRGLLVLLVTGTVGFWLQRSNLVLRQLAMGTGFTLGWGLLGYISFTYGSVILPVAVPMLVIALNSLTWTALSAVREQVEKMRLRRTFERYVAAPIVAEILQKPEDYQSLLEGRQVKAAVLFSDIRGFTTLSEQLSEAGQTRQLVQQLNTYLDGMVRAITQEGGTIDKFIGDAVMAEFGCPVSRGEQVDALNAVRAALAMRRTLVQLRSHWVAEGKTPFFNGIGINYGELIAGNIGSLSRLEYTVIGDTVNVASRVEAMTKQFGVDILITESLYTLVKDQIQAEFMGHHPLKGHTEVALYSVIGLKDEDPALCGQVWEQLRDYLHWHR